MTTRLRDAVPLATIGAVLIVGWFLRGLLLWLASGAALILGRALHAVVGVSALQGIAGFAYLNSNWSTVAAYTGEHLRLALITLAVGLAIALPVGVLVNRVRWLYVPVFSLLDGIYTIPSIALFVVLVSIPQLGLSEKTALIVMIAYAQFILVRNVAAGMEGVPSETKEAALGMGMNRLQVFLRVELPLALPVIVGGLRIAAVATIGIATVAAFITIHDLGYLFTDALNNYSKTQTAAEIEAGAIAVTFLAISADLALRFVERLIPANRVARAGRPSRLRSYLQSPLTSRAAPEEEALAQSRLP